MATLKAYHGKPKIRDKYLRRVRAHRKADQIIQRYGYWRHGKGCAVGCTIHSDRHAAYETELGIPQIIARLEDRIFEGLPKLKARDWPLQFLTSIKCGADLSMVWPAFAVWLLTDDKHGALQHAKTTKTKKVITRVSNLYCEWLKTGVMPQQRRRIDAHHIVATVATVATDATAAAAAAAAAAAFYADAAAVYAAVYADIATVYAATAAAAAAAGSKTFWIAASEELLRILSNAKMS